MDGANYLDTRAPFDIAATPPASVTLASTDKAIYTPSEFPSFGPGYWWVGKQFRIRACGKATTGATPGNGTWDIYWGTGADANGTILASSVATALAANQSNISWWLDLLIECTVRGSSGKLMVTGLAFMNALLTTNVPMPIPATSPVASSAIDLTSSSIISVQYKRSGSTAETMQLLSLQPQPQN